MVAACKVVPITKATTTQQRKELHKEIKVHENLQHRHVLDFLGSLVIEEDSELAREYIPAMYMLMELAGAGDLFDKIGKLNDHDWVCHEAITNLKSISPRYRHRR